MVHSGKQSTLSPDDESVAHAHRLLSEAAHWIASGQPAAIERAISVSTDIIELWQRPEFLSIASIKRWLATACLVNGNTLRETQKPELRPTALRAYAQALEYFKAVMQPDNSDDVN